MSVKQLAIFVALVIAIASVAALPPTKKLAGPPEEFIAHRIPDPRKVITTEHSTSLYLYFVEKGAKEFSTKVSIPVDGKGDFAFSVSGPFNSASKLTMYDPLGENVNLDEDEVPVRPYSSHLTLGPLPSWVGQSPLCPLLPRDEERSRSLRTHRHR